MQNPEADEHNQLEISFITYVKSARHAGNEQPAANGVIFCRPSIISDRSSTRCHMDINGSLERPKARIDGALDEIR
jgi:hypothetical protein